MLNIQSSDMVEKNERFSPLGGCLCHSNFCRSLSANVSIHFHPQLQSRTSSNFFPCLTKTGSWYLDAEEAPIGWGSLSSFVRFDSLVSCRVTCPSFTGLHCALLHESLVSKPRISDITPQEHKPEVITFQKSLHI